MTSPSEPVSLGRVAGGALVLAAALAGCVVTQPGVPAGVDPPPAPFERAPYVQAAGPDTAVVRWRTARPGVATEVRYRRHGSGWTRAEVERMGAAGDGRAVLRGLAASSTVEFTVEAGGTELGPYRFATAPPDTAEAGVDVLAFGDSGWGSAAQTELARRMGDRSWDLAVHVGDLAYPDGSEEDFTVRHFRVYGPLFARVPFFPSPGNHDVRPAGGGGEAYDRAFEWPGAEEDRRFYAFRWGRAQFLALDTSTDSAVAALVDREGGQRRWLRQTLEAASRDTTVRWTVVFTHRPLYSRAYGLSGHGPDRDLREALEPLFLRHGVDLVLTGHDHHYERSFPLRDGEVAEPGCGPVYMVTGGGGATRMARPVAPGGTAARVSRAHHFVALSLDPDGGSGEAVGRDGEVLDRFGLTPYEPDGRGAGACPGG